MCLEISQNSQENTFCNFIKTETLAQVFSGEFCEISKNTFSYRTPPVAASVCNYYKIALTQDTFSSTIITSIELDIFLRIISMIFVIQGQPLKLCSEEKVPYKSRRDAWKVHVKELMKYTSSLNSFVEIEAALQNSSQEKVFLNYAVIFQENIHVEVLFQ